MRTLANSVDPDEMKHNVAFHQCLHCLLTEKRKTILYENINYDHSIYTMDHTKYIVPNQKEETISA